MMKISIATLFPKMCETVVSESIIGRAIKKEIVQIECVDIRDYSKDKHRRVDDTPYGGGKGMVMQCDPLYNAYLDIEAKSNNGKPYVIYMSPKGKTLTQQKAKELSKLDNIFILCGHYEGVDERILEEIVDEEISIGDFVLTGGELPALILVDTVVRLVDGVLSDSVCFEEESHYNGLLEYPHYTRPEIWRERKVPDVLLSGHHENIRKWRLDKSLEQTEQKRPELYKLYTKKSKK